MAARYRVWLAAKEAFSGGWPIIKDFHGERFG